MLRIINDLRFLEVFFEDCYRRVNVREFGRIMGISAPTASKMLAHYHSEGILSKEDDRNYIFYFANKDSKDFIELSKRYWRKKLSKLISYMEKKLIDPKIVLFGSLSKSETKIDSDVDLAVFAHKRELDLEKFEKKLKRSIQIFWFKSLNDVKNKELANNVINGHILKGRLSI